MKKIFYNKRHKVPVSSQVYLAWLLLFSFAALWIYKMEIVKPAVHLNKSYNQKKENEIISALQLKSLALYPNTHEFNRTVIYNINESLRKFKWSIEEVGANHQKLDCKFTRYYHDNEVSNLVIIFDQNKVSNTFYLVHTLALGIIQENVHNVSVVSVQGSPLCNDYLVKKYYLESNPKTDFLYAYGANVQNPVLQIANYNEQFASVNWSGIIPDSIKRPGLLKQLANSGVTLFQKTVFHQNVPAVHAINIAIPNEVFQNEVFSIDTILPPLFYTIKSYSSIHKTAGVNIASNNVFWITSSTGLSKRGMVILTVFLIMLIWLPLANRLYESESINYIFRSLFSAIFSSMVFFITAGLIKLGSLVWPTSTYAALSIPVVFFGLHWMFSKIKKNLFDININSLTEFIILNIFTSILAFHNFAMLIFIMPAIFMASKKGKTEGSVFRFLMMISFVPLVCAIYLTAGSLSLTDHMSIFSLAWFNQVVFLTYPHQALSSCVLEVLLQSVKKPGNRNGHQYPCQHYWLRPYRFFPGK